MPELPDFPYHPDPVASGSVIASDAVCVCCEQARGFVYAGPVYATEEYDQCICPWCIADGSAHEQLSASFTDEDGIGDYGSWDAVPEAVVAQVSHRTPGFSGWQQERWWTHCGDAAAFIAPMGHAQLLAIGPEAIEAIRPGTGLSGKQWELFSQSLDRDGGPTAFLFRCRHCRKLGGYQDCH